jgi:HD-GYP domain-containing protein (c-di-GMP phosphodiesterase class II)
LGRAAERALRSLALQRPDPARRCRSRRPGDSRLGTNLAAAADGRGYTYRLGGDEFCVLAATTPESAVTLLESAADALAEEGEGFSVTASFGAVFLPDEAGNPRSALRVADQRLYAQKHSARLGRGRPHEVLLQALFEREPELRLHVQSVTDLSLGVGRRLGFNPEELEQLRLAAELHDVGKLAIPDTVLRKKGDLDEAEWEFVRQHTIIGQRILDAAPALYEVGKLVRSSHERWDGTGYVDGLAGEEIPLAARIISVCDAFAAMTSDRPYRGAVSADEAVEELHRCAGSQFDPSIVEIFCAELAERAAAQAA